MSSPASMVESVPTVKGRVGRTVPRPPATHLGAWVGYVLLLVLAPLVFPGGAALAILSQLGCSIVFGLSYNMLLGQSGMLSFGHAVYLGLGAYFAAHAMNAAAAGTLWLPVVLAPLVAAVGASIFGLLFGYLTSQKSGTTFAMITFGIGELVHTAAAMFPAFFGGDSGIATTRSYGKAPWGLSFGPPLQAYYLIAAWVLLATVAMYAVTQTPFGRIMNATRDNAQRVRMLGYDPKVVRLRAQVISSFFAGLAGGLMVVNFEVVTAETLSAAQSGSVLLFTFIGGTTVFAGPIVGAVIGTLLTLSVSTVTPAWPLYLGIFFIVVVKFAPAGITGAAMALWNVACFRQIGFLAPRLIAATVAVVVASAGTVALTELAYALTLGSGVAPSSGGGGLNPHSMSSWGIAVGILVAGLAAVIWLGRGFRERWDEAQSRIGARQNPSQTS